MRKLFLVILVAIFACACAPVEEPPASTVAITPVSTPAPSASASTTWYKSPVDSLKLGFIYRGTSDDNGWSYSHDFARQQLEKKYSVQTVIVENVKTGSDYENVIRELLVQDCNVIVSTAQNFVEDAEKAAKAHPEAIFLQYGGKNTLQNLSVFDINAYETSYLCGMIAAQISDKLGYVAAYPEPEIIACVNAFALGAKEIDPDATVSLSFSNAWNNQGKETAAAMELIAKGCDVLAQYQDTATVVKVAAQSGAYAIGSHWSMKSDAPSVYITAPIINWTEYYGGIVSSIMEGKFKPSKYVEGIASSILQLDDVQNVTPHEDVDKIKQRFIDGDMRFEGVIKDNTEDNSIRVKKGESITVPPSDWLVENISGELPE